MKTKKLNFASIKNVLGKEEMKKIMAGSSGVPGQVGGIAILPKSFAKVPLGEIAARLVKLNNQ